MGDLFVHGWILQKLIQGRIILNFILSNRNDGVKRCIASQDRQKSWDLINLLALYEMRNSLGKWKLFITQVFHSMLVSIFQIAEVWCTVVFSSLPSRCLCWKYSMVIYLRFGIKRMLTYGCRGTWTFSICGMGTHFV